MTLNALDISILGPAFLAGLVVLSTHVPLGREVLARGIIFLDLAVAQFAALGLIVADTWGGEAGAWSEQLIAAGAALGGALVLQMSERRWPAQQEALIGSAFVVTSSLGILLLAHNPHGGEELKSLLAGQILWVTPQQIGYTGALSALLIALGVWRGFGGRLFYPIFALAVTASVQLVGVYLVFASLILPALATRNRPNGLAFALLVGTLGYAVGLAAAALYDLPAGPAAVCGLAACAVVTARLRRA